MKEENGSYAVTRHLVHEEQGPGRVRRVTAAVVVNDRMTSEGAGKLEHTVWKPRGPEEMHRLEQLAQAAVGFDEGRGDTVVIENVSFSSNVAAVKPPPMQALAEQAGGLLRDQPGLLRTLGIAAVGVSLVMVVVRPLTRQMVAVLKEPVPPRLIAEPAEPGTRAVQIPGTASERPGGSSLPTPPSMPAIFFDVAKRSSDAQGIYEHVSAHIRKEPAQSTRLLQSWIGAPAEESE
jgi:flagellar M-ring protein FliF